MSKNRLTHGILYACRCDAFIFFGTPANAHKVWPKTTEVGMMKHVREGRGLGGQSRHSILYKCVSFCRWQLSFLSGYKRKVKEADLYSAFIEVPYTLGAQVRITQCYLQITPYLPLPRKHSPDGASQTEVADI